MSARSERRVAICADVGSTFTKVAAVDLGSGGLLATAEHRTTVETDVLHGLDAAIEQVTQLLPARADISTVDVCSSAGGGLRLAVVGYEQLVTAEAGHRVGLSAGARVVHVAAGLLDGPAVDGLRAARPDVVLLVGGTDGGEAEVLHHNARRLAAVRLRVPVVVAGNVDARDEVCATLQARGVPVVPTENVLPRIGELNPQPARAAIREVFLRHVIGGKRLSRGPRFASLVRGATPDLVLTAVELLADHLAGDLVVVDVGGATTDVYSVLSPDPDPRAAPAKEVAGTLWRSRTVEGDLGMRWSATGVVDAGVAERLIAERLIAERLVAERRVAERRVAERLVAERLVAERLIAERLIAPADVETLAAAARARADDPAFLPVTETDHAMEMRFARLAATIALRRHARGEPARPFPGVGSGGRASAKDMRRVRLLVGSGGVLRHASPAASARVLDRVLDDHAGGWAPPRGAQVVVDREYVLAPAGLLATDHPNAALALLRGHLIRIGEHAGATRRRD